MIDPFNRPIPRPIDIQAGRTYIVCEGTDEVAVVRALADLDGLSVVAGTLGHGESLEQEIRQFCLAAKRKGPKALGIIVDKEKDGARTIRALTQALQMAGVTEIPEAGSVADSIIDGAGIRIGIILNPASQNSGALEQLFVAQIEPRVAACVEDFVTCLQTSRIWENRQSLDILMDKVRVRAYLAAKNSGGNTGINVALHDGHFSVDTPEFGELRALLSTLAA